MDITKETVQYVAHLTRIGLTDEELAKFTPQLNHILRYINQLKEVDIAGIAPTAHVLPMKNVKRKDILKESFPFDEVLKNAPQKEGNFFKVPRVIE